ncbi:hypothetical protein TKK_0001015 [Trichogramma kaykai]
MLRRLLRVGLQTTLPQLQENVKRAQSLVTPLLFIEPRVLITSCKTSFIGIIEESSKEDSIVLAELSVLDSHRNDTIS